MVKAIERLNDIDLTFYFGNLSVEEFVIYIELIADRRILEWITKRIHFKPMIDYFTIIGFYIHREFS